MKAGPQAASAGDAVIMRYAKCNERRLSADHAPKRRSITPYQLHPHHTDVPKHGSPSREGELAGVTIATDTPAC